MRDSVVALEDHVQAPDPPPLARGSTDIPTLTPEAEPQPLPLARSVPLAVAPPLFPTPSVTPNPTLGLVHEASTPLSRIW